jgi:adenylate kinase
MKSFMNLDVIFFIGPQGSGKGTQAKLLAEKLDFFYWEMGAIFREIASHDDDLGKRISGMINQGIYIDDETTLAIVKEKMATVPQDKGIIFDGLPRRVSQAEYLLPFLISTGKEKLMTIFLDVPHDDSVKRLLHRAEIEGRKDDTKESIERRLLQYTSETVPVLDYLRSHTNFTVIDGRPPIPAVTEEIDKIFGFAS